jgi:hypothetical protein
MPPLDMAVLLEVITRVREKALADTTTISFCMVPSFFDAQGNAILPQPRLPPRWKYDKRSDCPREELSEAEAPIPYGVAIYDYTTFPDSVRVWGRTRMPGGTRTEAYIFLRVPNGRLWFSTFRITSYAIVQDVGR